MRYSTVFKFIAFVLCAATLLGAVGSATALVALTEMGGKSVYEHYVEEQRSLALEYARIQGESFCSQELGGATQQIFNERYPHGWRNWYLDWSRVAYVMYDSDGNPVEEMEMIDKGHDVVFAETIPVFGEYMKVLSTTPYEEYYPEATEPVVLEESHIYVMPAQEMTEIGEIFVGYTDGHTEEYRTGEVLGTLWYHGGNTLTFESNEIGNIPAGDGWYPNNIEMKDMGGNVVYNAIDSSCVFVGEEQDGNFYKIHLPAGMVTSSAPVGLTYTEGEYTAYDAIPVQGTTVTSMHVTYANVQGEILGSEGISSSDLIGTIFHDHQGNAEFHSTEPMTMDIPENCVITDITFADAQQNCIFEASCPSGVGGLTNDENGYLVFRGTMHGTEVPEATVPEESTEVEGTEVPEETVGVTGFAKEELHIYSAPSVESKIIGTVDAWQEIEIVKQDKYNGVLWGLVPGGWVLMEQVLVGESNVPAEAAMLPDDAAEDTALPEATIPAEAARDVALPEETVTVVTEPEVQAAPEQADMETEPVTAEEEMPTEPAAALYPEEDIETVDYYDSELQQRMVVEYVLEPIPEGYTMDIQLGRGALRNEFVWTLLRLADAFRQILLEVLGICIAVFVLCVIHLSCSAGRTRRNNEVRAGGLNRIPLDLYCAGGGFAVVGLVAAAMYGSEYFARNDQQLALVFCGACGYLASLMLVGFFFAFVAQIKTPGGYWWRNSLCGRCMKLAVWCCTGMLDLGIKGWLHGMPRIKKAAIGLWRSARKAVLWLWDTGKRLGSWITAIVGKCLGWTTTRLVRFFGLLPITWQFLLTGFTLVFLLYVVLRSYKVGWILVGFGLFFATILYAASAFAILLESAKRMSKGDLDTKVDDRMLIGGFRDFAGQLNDLADVAVVAAQKQLKSERMKTELITNVSHDIKTPLTSIINYVDLLQKPHTEAQQSQYLEVLDRQSQRLKKLIDDLMEMSKASTGNMTVEICRMDAVETVNQVFGEFADKLERAQLMPVFRQPEEPAYMMADGRLVWRVMSNLLGNAVKYALPGTRIYVDLLEMDGKVIISMKNISREELNVHADELMERFVRGDASRNTEGSGLGLNIAQSLMELQKGQLQILVDGDLFKVTLIFPAA